MLISNLSIPEPCPENWENMRQTQKGKFCDLCSKEVIDFTKWTDAEIIQYFENMQASATNKSGKTCGRLSTQQVERINQILQNHTSQQANLWRIFAWAFSASALSSIVALQNVNAAEKPVNQELIRAISNEIENKNINLESLEDTLRQPWVISGTVKNISNSIPFISTVISVKGTNLATVTDFNGNYELDLSKLSSQETITLQASASGFELYEQEITRTDTICNVNLIVAANPLKEVLVVGYQFIISGRTVVVTKKTNFAQRTWWRTKNFFRRIF
jgi:hypothetical protein